VTLDLLAVPGVVAGIGAILWIATRLEYLVAPPALDLDLRGPIAITSASAGAARSLAPNYDGGLGNTAA
jgi:hypothetical protein